MENLKEVSLEIVYGAIDELNEQLPFGQKLVKDTSTALLGEGGKLDSIGLVNLMALLEEKCEQRCGKSMSLFDDAAGAGANPFESVESLSQFLARKLGAKL
ncbi:MAG TPA: hypothetical protein VFY29_05340 [Terriglobia bacterium]|nr:hypothetical protein [Terriglobia bacterium]